MTTPTLTKNYEADAAATKYRIAKIGSADGKVAQAAAATDDLFGVFAEVDVAAAGDRADVHVAGIAFVEYGGVVARGNLLTSDANGKAIASTRHTHTENTAGAYTQSATTGVGTAERIIGQAMVSGVDGDVGEVQIAPGYA